MRDVCYDDEILYQQTQTRQRNASSTKHQEDRQV